MRRLVWTMLYGVLGCSSARVESGEAVVWSGPFSAEACRIPVAAETASGESTSREPPGSERSPQRVDTYEWELAAYRLCEARMNNWITNDEYKNHLSVLVSKISGASSATPSEGAAPPPTKRP